MEIKVTKNVTWDSDDNDRYMYWWGTVKVNNEDNSCGIDKNVGSDCINKLLYVGMS